MGAKPETIGGGGASDVSDVFSKFLLQGLTSGQFGGQTTAGDAFGRTDIGSIIDSLLSGSHPGLEGTRAALEGRRTSNVQDLRGRYNMAGSGYGTPAASAEARFLAEYDPQMEATLGNMQLDSIMKGLSTIMPFFSQAFQLGTPQAQTVMKPGLLSDIMGGVTGLAGMAAPFLMPGLGGGGGTNVLPWTPPVPTVTPIDRSK